MVSAKIVLTIVLVLRKKEFRASSPWFWQQQLELPLVSMHPSMRVGRPASIPSGTVPGTVLDSRETVLNKSKGQLFWNLLFGRRKQVIKCINNKASVNV